MAAANPAAEREGNAADQEECVIRSLDGVSPRVHPKAFVSEFAYVIGDVEIGEGSSV